ncbi:MAG: glycoside hydrolase domain-containing protein, partial [Actinomycetota bacterium]
MSPRIRSIVLVAWCAVVLALPAADASTSRAISFGGVHLRLPASWPVYDLDTDPARCVRFDVHAVYLGHGGESQDCPARALGKTDAVQVEPLDDRSLSHAMLEPARLNGIGVYHDPSAGVSGSFVTAVSRALVTVTHGTDAATANDILASIRGSTPSIPVLPAQPVSTSSSEQPSRAPLVAYRYPTMRGFDACTAPSARAMRAWLASPYRSVGVYLGGANRACGDGNLSASWMTGIERLGWSVVPIYVGLQSPCVGQHGLAKIDAHSASSQGARAASDAVARARHFGIASGNPIYFDMEAYRRTATCSRAVLMFLSSWTKTFHSYGYLSGVYGSADSTIRDLSGAYGGSAYARPDDVWIA